MLGPASSRPLTRVLAVGAAAALTVSLAAAVSASSAPAPAEPATRGLRLVSTSDTVDAYGHRGYVYLEPAVWLASYGQGVEFWYKRTKVSDPVTVTRTVVRDGRRTTSTVPARLVDGMNGLKDGLTLTVSTPGGQVLESSTRSLCPGGGWERQRVEPSGPSTERYPSFCGGAWFTKATVSGIEQGWASRVAEGVELKTDRRRLTVTVSISAPVAAYLGIPAGQRTVTQDVKVLVDECEEGCREQRADSARAGSAQPELGRIDDTDAPRSLRNAFSPTARPVPQPAATSGAARAAAAPAADTLPDLVSLPAWQISATAYTDGTDRLNFAANEWNAGPAPMVVEGFRRGKQPLMDAYQMFYRDGQVVSSQKTGTMEFHSAPEHNHWHFLDFAKYDLVKPDGTVVTTSGKQSWCLAPTDAIDLSVPGAIWRPETTGLDSSCGDLSALWLRETMPVGWGDTYGQDQTLAFDLSKVPHGTYRIRITVNPNGTILERTKANNVSLRTVVIGGRKGARTVTVPPYQGVDTETDVDLGDGELGRAAAPIPPGTARMAGMAHHAH